MEISVIQEKENPFLKRKEISLTVKHPDSATPSKADIIKKLAASNSVDELQVVIDYISAKKGITESFVKLKILKEKPKVEKKEEQQPKQEQKEEKPEAKPETKKEEKKPEKKEEKPAEVKENVKNETQAGKTA